MKLTELFQSFQGEGRWVGYPMTFIRIAGCPVGCPFCDTDYTKGEPREIAEITEQIRKPHVCVTGGEPLAHPDIAVLLQEILKNPIVRMVHVETSGCYQPPPIFYRYRQLFWLTVSPKGSFLGAKKDFIPEVLEDADEVKWIVPCTPTDLIHEYIYRCKSTYIQPENYTLDMNDENLCKALAVAEDLNLPLSVQLHKVFHWR